MRRTTAALVIGIVAATITPSGWGQSAPPFRRPQSKVMVYQPPTAGAAVIGVMGQVRRPGTYQVSGTPTVQAVLDAAQGFTPTASPMIRVVRGQRVAQRVAYPAAAQEKLLPGDLVIVDLQATRDGTKPAAEPVQGVQLAMLGVVDRPLIVKVQASRAKVDTIMQMLGQTTPAALVIPPPNLTHEQSPYLPDGSVLVFDPRRIDVAGLPDDLPKILLTTAEEPDIGAYGVHNALEQRSVSGQRDMQFGPAPVPAETDAVPLPSPELPRLSSPTASSSGRVPATFSSGARTGSQISRVPFSRAPANTPPLSESAPSQSSAADAQEPAWNQVAPAEPTIEAAAKPSKSRAALSLFQMAGILSCAGLLVAVALIIRAGQNRALAQQPPTAEKKEHRSSAGSSVERTRSAPHATVPVPHISLQGILKPEAAISLKAEPASVESLDTRLERFTQLIQNELPLMEEPLALRPGLRIVPAGEQPVVRRADSGVSIAPPPHRPAARLAPENNAASGGARQIIDEPHPQAMPAPHHRTSVGSPVERALRQLQGGLS